MNYGLIERLNIPPQHQPRTRTLYHDNGWIEAGRLRHYKPGAQRLFASVAELPNPDQNWELEAFKLILRPRNQDNRVQVPDSLEAVFYSDKPPTILEFRKREIEKIVERQFLFFSQTRKITKEKVESYFVLDIKNALNPAIFNQDPDKPISHGYRQSPSGFSYKDIPVPPLLSVSQSLRQARDSIQPRTPYYALCVIAQAFPIFTVEQLPKEDENLVVDGEDNSRLWFRIPIRDIRPVIQTMIQSLPTEHQDLLDSLQNKKDELEQALAMTDTAIAAVSRDATLLEILALQACLKNMPDNRTLPAGS